MKLPTIILFALLLGFQAAAAQTQTDSIENIIYIDSSNTDSIFQTTLQHIVNTSQLLISDYNQKLYQKSLLVNRKDSLDDIINKNNSDIETKEKSIDNDLLYFTKLDSLRQIQMFYELKRQLRLKYKGILEIERHNDSIESKLKYSLQDAENAIQTKLDDGKNAYENAKQQFEAIIGSDSAAVAFTIIYKNVTYRCFIANSNTHEVRIHNNGTGNKRSLRFFWDQMLKQGIKPLAIMNAGMYEPDGSAKGLLIENGKLYSKIDDSRVREKVNFYLYPNGVFYIDTAGDYYVEETFKFKKTQSPNNFKGIKYATQSGPMLVVDGKVHPSFSYGSPNKNIRNGVGVITKENNKKVVFVISDSECTFYDLAIVFKDILGCRNALYLDGAISKMYINYKKIRSGQLDGDLGPVISVSLKK